MLGLLGGDRGIPADGGGGGRMAVAGRLGVHPWTGSIPTCTVVSCESFRGEPVDALFLAVLGTNA